MSANPTATGTVTAEPGLAPGGPRRLCVFRIEQLRLGVEVTDVQEVTETLSVTVVPMSPRGVLGVGNLRGQLVTVLDLPALLGLAPDAARSAPEAPVDVIVRFGGELISLPADSVADVLDAAAQTRSRPPDNLTGPVRELVRAVHVLHADLVLELDIPALISAARSSSAARPSRGSQTP